MASPGTQGLVEGSSATSSELVDASTLARLSIHIKQNNIAYLIGTLVAYQIGILDKIFVYGTGVCG